MSSMVRSFPASHARISGITNLASDGLKQRTQSAHDAFLLAAGLTFPTVEAIILVV
jgi:hypothetical protein